jgi:hypothetical protein
MSSQTAVNSTFHPTLHHQGVPKHGFPQVLPQNLTMTTKKQRSRNATAAYSGNTVFWQQGGPVFLHVHTKVQVMLVIRWAMPVTLCGEEQRLLLPRIQSSSQQLLSDQGHLN